MAELRQLPQDYPPARHVLRDLGLWSDAGADPPCAGIEVVPALLGAAGACSAGALAVLVDAVAGGAALRAESERAARSAAGPRAAPSAAIPRAAPSAAIPGWIATSDLRLHWLARVPGGELVARTRQLRSGRTSVVLEVEVCQGERVVAHGTVAFSRLEAQGDYQRRPRSERLGRVSFASDGAGFAQPFAAAIGARVLAAASGELELPLTPYVGNSLGGLQGGIAVALLALAAEAAGAALLGRPVATRDLAVHFLAIGRSGPMRTRAELLRRDGDALLLRVESRDAGAGDRLCTIASATVAPAP